MVGHAPNHLCTLYDNNVGIDEQQQSKEIMAVDSLACTWKLCFCSCYESCKVCVYSRNYTRVWHVPGWLLSFHQRCICASLTRDYKTALNTIRPEKIKKGTSSWKWDSIARSVRLCLLCSLCSSLSADLIQSCHCSGIVRECSIQLALSAFHAYDVVRSFHFYVRTCYLCHGEKTWQFLHGLCASFKKSNASTWTLAFPVCSKHPEKELSSQICASKLNDIFVGSIDRVDVFEQNINPFFPHWNAPSISKALTSCEISKRCHQQGQTLLARCMSRLLANGYFDKMLRKLHHFQAHRAQPTFVWIDTDPELTRCLETSRTQE